MRQIKTIAQITQEHLAKTAASIRDPAQFNLQSQAIMTRMQSRMMHDPAVVSFSNHYGKALDEALKLLPPTMWPAAIQSLLLQVLIEWEDVHEEFNSQLKVTPNA